MGVPLLDLKAQWSVIGAEARAAIDRVVDSQQFILGPEVEALEREIADYCGAAYAIGVSSGTDALLVTLMALGIGPGDEVITTPFTFFATAGVIARLGATPVFVDIDLATFNIDPVLVAKAITDRTRAIIPVHLFGHIADMDPILSLGDELGLPVVEDAAQAIGASYRGRRAGSFGAAGCFSFFPSKNLGGLGDGGMVTTDQEDLAERVRVLRNHGFQPKYHSKVVGGNFRLDALQAAVLRVKLGRLDAWTRARQRNAESYGELFSASGLETRVGDGPVPTSGIVLPTAAPSIEHAYNQYVVRVRHRARVIELLRREQIGHEIYYPVPLHLQECFAALGYGPGDFPMSERAAAECLALPIYPELQPNQQQAVVDAVKAGCREGE